MPAFSASKLTVELKTAPRATQGPEEGAVGPVWAVTDPDIARVETAGHYVPKKGVSGGLFTRAERQARVGDPLSHRV
jgi:hypothetical protein